MCCNLSHTQYSDDAEGGRRIFLFSFFSSFSMHRSSFSPSKKFDRCMCVYMFIYLPFSRERGGGTVSVSHLLDKLLQQHIDNFH